MHTFLRSVLMLAFVMVANVSHAQSDFDAMRMCIVQFQMNQWYHVKDEEALTIAKEVFAQTNFKSTPIICAGNGGMLEFAARIDVLYGGTQYTLIGFHLPFRRPLGTAELRGIMAHEVAHRIKKMGECNLANAEEATICELAIDKEADRLLGSGTMVPVHDAAIRFLESFPLPRSPNIEIVLHIIKSRREALLK